MSSSAKTINASIPVILGSSAQAEYPLPAPGTGDLFVSIYYNDRISVYSPEGAFLRDFTGVGLSHGRGIVITRAGAVYVGSQREGGLIGVLTHEDFDSPQSFAFDDRGRVFITQFFSNAITVFDSVDRHLASLPAAPADAPRSLAFVPLDPAGLPDDPARMKWFGWGPIPTDCVARAGSIATISGSGRRG
jgi:hypothetical protein